METLLTAISRLMCRAASRPMSARRSRIEARKSCATSRLSQYYYKTNFRPRSSRAWQAMNCHSQCTRLEHPSERFSSFIQRIFWKKLSNSIIRSKTTGSFLCSRVLTSSNSKDCTGIILMRKSLSRKNYPNANKIFLNKPMALAALKLNLRNRFKAVKR